MNSFRNMGNMSSRRNSSRRLWSTLIVATIISCAAFVYLSLQFGKHYLSRTSRYVSAKQEEKQCTSICNSEECVHQSNFLLKRLNPAVEPCDDFYQFACGQYLDNIGGYRGESFVDQLDMRTRENIRNILDNLQAEPTSASGKLKTVYDSCTKKSYSDLKAMTTLLQFLTELGIPNWPDLAANFKFGGSGLKNVLCKLIAYKEYGVIDISLRGSYRYDFLSPANSTIVIMKSPYEERQNSERKDLVKRLLNYFSPDDEVIAKIWNETEAIQDEIIKLKEESERIHNEEEGPGFLEIDCELEAETEWKDSCELLQAFVDLANATSGISKRFANVYGSSIHFLKNIFTVLHNFSDGSIAHYLSLNVLLNHLDHLEFYFRLTLKMHPDLLRKFKNSDSIIGHSQYCTDWIMKNMFIILAHEYMKTVLTEPVLQSVEDLISEIMQETSEAVSEQEWISESLRTDMVTNTKELSLSISLIKNALLNETDVNYLYSEFHPEPKNFLLNVFEYQKHSKLVETRGVLEELDLLWIRPELFMAGASAGGSTIDMNFGILVPPVYNPATDRLINFVTLSTIVAHEIGHTLQQYQWKFRRSDENAKQTMDNINMCIENQYSNFRYDSTGINVNGSLFIHENVADLIAMSVIDKYIEKHLSSDDMLLLPALQYSTQQFLYASSIQVWCASHVKQDEELNRNFSSHSLPKFRLLGMIQNSKGFAKAFNCKEGSYMNPTNKCFFFMDKKKTAK